MLKLTVTAWMQRMQKQNVYPAGGFTVKSSSGIDGGHRIISVDAGMLLTTSDWELKMHPGKMDPDTSKTELEGYFILVLFPRVTPAGQDLLYFVITSSY